MIKRRDIFQAIADPTRREIIRLVATKPLNINGLVDQFDVSRPTISKHIKVLTECDLVVVKQSGRERYCEVKVEKLDEVTDWVQQCREIWENRFESLDNLLNELKQNSKTEKNE